MGISLGKANYCLRALIERGWVKVGNFSRSGNKAVYFYRLTPAGLSERVRTTHLFQEKKLEEHDQVTSEIARLRAELTTEMESRKRTPDD